MPLYRKGGTPSSHASSHQHGGSDEVATATAAANVIPKTGSDGKLSADFLPLVVGQSFGRKTSTTTINNTAAETTVYSGTIPANTLTTERVVSLILFGDYFNNTGGNRTFIVKAKLAGGVVYEGSFGTFATSTSRRPWRLHMELGAKASASAQWFSLRWNQSSVGAPSTGQGVFGGNSELVGSGAGDLGLTSTSDISVEVTVTLSNAASTHELTSRYGWMRVD